MIGTQEGGVYRSYANLPTLATQLQIGDTADHRARAGRQEGGGDERRRPRPQPRPPGRRRHDRQPCRRPRLRRRCRARRQADRRRPPRLQGGKTSAPFRTSLGLGAASDDTAVSPRPSVSTPPRSPPATSSRSAPPSTRARPPSSSPSPSTPPTTWSPPPRALPAIAGDLLRRELGFKGGRSPTTSAPAPSRGHRRPDAAVRASPPAPT